MEMTHTELDSKIHRYLNTKGYVGIQDFTKEDLPALRDHLTYLKSFAKDSKESIDKMEMAVKVVEGKYA